MICARECAPCTLCRSRSNYAREYCRVTVLCVLECVMWVIKVIDRILTGPPLFIFTPTFGTDRLNTDQTDFTHQPHQTNYKLISLSKISTLEIRVRQVGLLVNHQSPLNTPLALFVALISLFRCHIIPSQDGATS